MFGKLFPKYQSIRPKPSEIEDETRLLVATQIRHHQIMIDNLSAEIIYLQECKAKHEMSLAAMQNAESVINTLAIGENPARVVLKSDQLFDFNPFEGKQPHIVVDNVLQPNDVSLFDPHKDDLETALKDALNDADFSEQESASKADSRIGRNIEADGSSGGKEPKTNSLD